MPTRYLSNSAHPSFAEVFNSAERNLPLCDPAASMAPQAMRLPTFLHSLVSLRLPYLHF